MSNWRMSPAGSSSRSPPRSRSSRSPPPRSGGPPALSPFSSTTPTLSQALTPGHTPSEKMGSPSPLRVPRVSELRNHNFEPSEMLSSIVTEPVPPRRRSDGDVWLELLRSSSTAGSGQRSASPSASSCSSGASPRPSSSSSCSTIIPRRASEPLDAFTFSHHSSMSTGLGLYLAGEDEEEEEVQSPTHHRNHRRFGTMTGPDAEAPDWRDFKERGFGEDELPPPTVATRPHSHAHGRRTLGDPLLRRILVSVFLLLAVFALSYVTFAARK